jgi:N utilization substance protein B
MVMTRHEQRYKAMTILYQAFLYDNNNIKYDIKNIIDEQMEEKSKFVNNLVMGVIDDKESIDRIANKYLENWDIDRLSKVDKAIFSIGIYELMYTDTPSVVAINEAIELSKVYSDEAVTKMINGVLDKVYHEEVKTDE